MARGLGTALGVAVVTLALHTAARWAMPPPGPRRPWPRWPSVPCRQHGPGAASAPGATAAPSAPAGMTPDGAPVTATASGGAAGGAGARADGLAEGVARLRRALRRGARVASPGNQLAVAQLELLSVVAEHPGTGPVSWPGCCTCGPTPSPPSSTRSPPAA